MRQESVFRDKVIDGTFAESATESNLHDTAFHAVSVGLLAWECFINLPFDIYLITAAGWWSLRRFLMRASYLLSRYLGLASAILCLRLQVNSTPVNVCTHLVWAATIMISASLSMSYYLLLGRTLMLFPTNSDLDRSLRFFLWLTFLVGLSGAAIIPPAMCELRKRQITDSAAMNFYTISHITFITLALSCSLLKMVWHLRAGRQLQEGPWPHSFARKVDVTSRFVQARRRGDQGGAKQNPLVLYLILQGAYTLLLIEVIVIAKAICRYGFLGPHKVSPAALELGMRLICALCGIAFRDTYKAARSLRETVDRYALDRPIGPWDSRPKSQAPSRCGPPDAMPTFNADRAGKCGSLPHSDTTLAALQSAGPGCCCGSGTDCGYVAKNDDGEGPRHPVAEAVARIHRSPGLVNIRGSCRPSEEKADWNDGSAELPPSRCSTPEDMLLAGFLGRPSDIEKGQAGPHLTPSCRSDATTIPLNSALRRRADSPPVVRVDSTKIVRAGGSAEEPVSKRAGDCQHDGEHDVSMEVLAASSGLSIRRATDYHSLSLAAEISRRISCDEEPAHQAQQLSGDGEASEAAVTGSGRRPYGRQLSAVSWHQSLLRALTLSGDVARDTINRDELLQGRNISGSNTAARIFKLGRGLRRRERRVDAAAAAQLRLDDFADGLTETETRHGTGETMARIHILGYSRTAADAFGLHSHNHSESTAGCAANGCRSYDGDDLLSISQLTPFRSLPPPPRAARKRPDV